jgi:hypothetical protein
MPRPGRPVKRLIWACPYSLLTRMGAAATLMALVLVHYERRRRELCVAAASAPMTWTASRDGTSHLPFGHGTLDGRADDFDRLGPGLPAVWPGVSVTATVVTPSVMRPPSSVRPA